MARNIFGCRVAAIEDSAYSLKFSMKMRVTFSPDFLELDFIQIIPESQLFTSVLIILRKYELYIL